MYDPKITAMQVAAAKQMNVFLKEFRDHFFSKIIDFEQGDNLAAAFEAYYKESDGGKALQIRLGELSDAERAFKDISSVK